MNLKTRRFLVLTAALSVVSSAVRAEVGVGQTAPDFSLTDISGQSHSLAGFKGQTVVLEWTNPDCPFVKKHYESGNMQEIQKTYTAKGVIWLTINSSAPGKQGNYTPAEWQKWVSERGVSSTAVLLDPDGKAGKLYGAKTTPHLFIVNPAGQLVYQGAIDSNPSADPADIKEARNYVREALDETLSGSPVTEPSTRSYGCSVKY